MCNTRANEIWIPVPYLNYPKTFSLLILFVIREFRSYPQENRAAWGSGITYNSVLLFINTIWADETILHQNIPPKSHETSKSISQKSVIINHRLRAMTVNIRR
ncbi:hypothetical protein BG32_07230 [Mesotoga sp. HF07.pep.5.2.highcov]|nr:hypothetical protein BG32_07230 [Mesotoga sp. HF07.pep.5.2.highcov]